MRTCEECLQPFHTEPRNGRSGRDRLTCGPACARARDNRSRAWRKAGINAPPPLFAPRVESARTVERPKRACEVCAGLYTPKARGGGRTQRWCGDVCAKEGARRRNREEWPERSEAAKVAYRARKLEVAEGVVELQRARAERTAQLETLRALLTGTRAAWS